MSYVDQLLADNERIEYEAHQHLFVFLARIIAETLVLVTLLGAVFFVSKVETGRWANVRPILLIVLGALALVVLASAIVDFLRWRNERFLLTDRRVIHLRGIINKSTFDSSLEKINDVQMRQTFFGRMFNYGDLEVQTASEGGDNFMANIEDPLKFKRAMLNAKAIHERGPYGMFDAASLGAYQQPGSNGTAMPRLSQLEVEEQLMRLAELRQKNLITDADYDAKKRDILNRM